MHQNDRSSFYFVALLAFFIRSAFVGVPRCACFWGLVEGVGAAIPPPTSCAVSHSWTVAIRQRTLLPILTHGGRRWGAVDRFRLTVETAKARNTASSNSVRSFSFFSIGQNPPLDFFIFLSRSAKI